MNDTIRRAIEAVDSPAVLDGRTPLQAMREKRNLLTNATKQVVEAAISEQRGMHASSSARSTRPRHGSP